MSPLATVGHHSPLAKSRQSAAGAELSISKISSSKMLSLRLPRIWLGTQAGYVLIHCKLGFRDSILGIYDSILGFRDSILVTRWKVNLVLGSVISSPSGVRGLKASFGAFWAWETHLVRSNLFIWHFHKINRISCTAYRHCDNKNCRYGVPPPK